MTRVSTASLAGLLLVASASSASAIQVWQGHLFITAASKDCVDAGWTVNRFFNAVLRPYDIEDNGPNTLLALFQDRYAASYSFAGSLSGNRIYSARHITSTAGGGGPSGPWSGWYSRGRVRPVPTESRPYLTVRVVVSDFAHTAGCNVKLEGTLGLRPNL
jgi:hypothetical protein